MRVDDTLIFLRGSLLLLGAAFALSSKVLAQGADAQRADAQGVACKGETISRIEISTRPPFEVRGSQLHQRIARNLSQIHATTNPAIVSRFLALQPGMQCTELRRQESERILRAQPYLADATVTAFPDADGSVYLSVVTVDEISLILGGGASSSAPYLRALRLGEANLMGEAVSVVVNWRHSDDFRDLYAAKVTDYQFLGRPYHLTLQGARRELGGEWELGGSHPFLTELQRVSWRATAGSRDAYRYFRRPAPEPVAVRLAQSYGDVGGVVRLGPPGRLALLGASVSYERELPQPFPTMVTLGRTIPDTTSVLVGRYGRHSSARVNALAGVRDLTFMRVTGFETLDGAQDVRKGLEMASLIGRGVDAFGAREHDLFASANVYAGFGSPSAFAAFEVVGEGRHDRDTGKWDGLLASGRLATYLKPALRQTLTTSIEWSGGWRQRIPFQLSFADRDGGLRGYHNSWLAGGKRVVARIEDRFFMASVKQFGSLGAAPFVDVGKLWAGDAPFGTNTPLSTSVGLGLLASVPPRSQRLWRLDLAYPLNRADGARFEARLTSVKATRRFWKEPGDVSRNRAKSVPTSVFNWP